MGTYGTKHGENGLTHWSLRHLETEIRSEKL